MEQYLHWDEIPLDESTARSLLQILKDMHAEMIAASKDCVTKGSELIEMLKHLKVENYERHKVRCLFKFPQKNQAYAF